ncbi:hypothetical protein [Halalkalibacter hemicellulosilyticus]|uniref:hypothetical protein n=1 Tax=Halalkalibacter hemicellulosilyticus TaxID=127886 RepID=UPI000B2FF5A8|nr:hypothetical protein [Halalkalibacter hemicellulosilyticus]
MANPNTQNTRKSILLLALDFILVGISLICLLYLLTIYGTVSHPILLLITFSIIIISSTIRLISTLYTINKKS